MEILRKKELVNQYHFDMRNPDWEEKSGVPKTNVEVNFHLLKKEEDKADNATSLIAAVRFMIVFQDFVISGGISQENRILGRQVDEPGQFNQAEVQEIAGPILQMLNRLTYDVTEIALDAPGINLEF